MLQSIETKCYLVFTFNKKNIKVWIAMMRAVAKRVYLPEDGVLFQDFIESYKNSAPKICR